MIYCTCGHLLRESESSRHLHQWRLDALLIPHYVIKKGRPRGARHGKTEAQKEHFVAHSARRRCIKKNFDGIHDRFQRDLTYRDSQLKIGWTEEKCIEMDKLAQEDHSYRLSREEYLRYQEHWYLTLSKSVHRQMFDSRIPQELLKSCLVRREVNANSAAWSYDMEGHATKNIDQLCEVSTLCIDDHQFEPEELEAVGEVSQVCSQIVLKCLLSDAHRQTWRSVVWKQTGIGKLYSRQATDSVDCENSSVSFVMKYCATPTVVRNPSSGQIFINRSGC